MDQRFQGKICPFCKTPFQEDDVIVVCSVCEMPHHLSCWQENNGCTTFGCTGTMKEIVGGAASSDLQAAAPQATIRPVWEAPVQAVREAEHAWTVREVQLHEAEERIRLAQMEQERKEAEALDQKKARQKKIRKRTGLIAAAVLLACFLAYATGWHIIPYARYLNACKALKAQSFDEAYEVFVALGTFSDSADKAVDTLYQKGVYLMDTGAYLEAAAEFDLVPDYLDSQELALRCRNEAAYLDAKALFEAGSYKEAADAFDALADYSDSAEQVKASNYYYAQELLENGDYEEAHTIFTALSGYEDSKDLANECYYRLAIQLFDEKKYNDAYYHFSWLPLYKDSEERAVESAYLYAVERFDAGDYENAAVAFELVGNYKGSEERAIESRYLYAADRFDAGDYENATAAFELAGNYKDAKDRLSEAKYRYALDLTEREGWDTAADLFKELGDYKDSASRFTEAYYQSGLSWLNSAKNSDNTESGTSFWSSFCYYRAIEIFETLGNYKDSPAKLNEAKYEYALIS